MMVGTASVGIGLVQFSLGAWVGGLFSLCLGGFLWTGVAVHKEHRRWHQGLSSRPPLGLWISRSVLLGVVLILGVRVLFS